MVCFKIFHKKKIVPSLVSTSPWKQFEIEFEQKRKAYHHPSYDTVYSEDDIIALEERHSMKPSLRASSDKDSVNSEKKMVHFSEFVSEAYIQSKSSSRLPSYP